MSNDRIRDGKAAFIKAKSEMPSPQFNKTNPHFKNDYADYPECRRCAYGSLKENNLSISTGFKVRDGILMLVNTIMFDVDVDINESSEWPISMTITPQQQGSAATYAKRYNLVALCDLVADQDDDAEVAEAPSQEKTQKKDATNKALKDLNMTTTDLNQSLRNILSELSACENLEERQNMILTEPSSKRWQQIIKAGNVISPNGEVMPKINKLVEGISWTTS